MCRPAKRAGTCSDPRPNLSWVPGSDDPGIPGSRDPRSGILGHGIPGSWDPTVSTWGHGSWVPGSWGSWILGPRTGRPEGRPDGRWTLALSKHPSGHRQPVPWTGWLSSGMPGRGAAPGRPCGASRAAPGNLSPTACRTGGPAPLGRCRTPRTCGCGWRRPWCTLGGVPWWCTPGGVHHHGTPSGYTRPPRAPSHEPVDVAYPASPRGEAGSSLPNTPPRRAGRLSELSSTARRQHARGARVSPPCGLLSTSRRSRDVTRYRGTRLGTHAMRGYHVVVRAKVLAPTSRHSTRVRACCSSTLLLSAR